MSWSCFIFSFVAMFVRFVFLWITFIALFILAPWTLWISIGLYENSTELSLGQNTIWPRINVTKQSWKVTEETEVLWSVEQEKVPLCFRPRGGAVAPQQNPPFPPPRLAKMPVSANPAAYLSVHLPSSACTHSASRCFSQVSISIQPVKRFHHCVQMPNAPIKTNVN